MTEKEFRPVNQLLGAKPSLGPIPADQVVPWVGFAFSSYLLGNLFGLNIQAQIFIAVWLCSTWWILTGSSAWKYLSKFQFTPAWTRGDGKVQPLEGIEVRRRKAQ